MRASTASLDFVGARPSAAGEFEHRADYETGVWHVEDVLCNALPTHTRVVVRDADGNRFVLVPQDYFDALQRSAPASAGNLGSSSRTPDLDPFLRRQDTTLTKREQQVLQLAAAGQPGSATARQLGLASNTVAQHLVAVRRKYGVRSTAAAVAVARQAGHIA